MSYEIATKDGESNFGVRGRNVKGAMPPTRKVAVPVVQSAPVVQAKPPKTMAEADAEFVKKMSAEWVGRDEDVLIEAVRQLCRRANDELFKAKSGDSAAPSGVFPVLTKTGHRNFGGLAHSPFFLSGNLPKGTSWQDQSGFAPLDDFRKPPMMPYVPKEYDDEIKKKWGPSMGPNVISNFSFDAEFPRVNLFQGSVNHVQNMLAAFFEYRCNHESAIFDRIVDAMKPPQKDGKITRNDPAYYAKTLEVLQCVQTHMKEAKGQASAQVKPSTLEDFGLGLVSFCQTWEVKVEAPSQGDFQRHTVSADLPNFSVASPHFQTRVAVVDDAKLRDCLSRRRSADTEDLIAAYVKNAEELTKVFTPKVASYEGKFVNLDDLWEKIKNFDGFKFEPCKVPCAAPLRETLAHAFFLHAAPCGHALQSLKHAHGVAKYEDAPFTVFIAGDWKTFVNHKDIGSLPSNFRAPEKTRDGKGGVHILNDEKWESSQRHVATSLSDILAYLRDENIEVLYTSIGRADRPVSVTGAKLTVMGTEVENNTGPDALRIVMQMVTENDEVKAFWEIFESQGINIVDEMNRVLKAYGDAENAGWTVEKLLNKFAVTRGKDDESMGVSFMADVLSVAFGVGHAIGCDGFFKRCLALTKNVIKPVNGKMTRTFRDGEDAVYEKKVSSLDLKAERSQMVDKPEGGERFEPAIVNGRYVACVDQAGLMEMVKVLLMAQKTAVFAHSTVWEDPGLNDADDYVATALIKKFSKTCHTDKFDWKTNIFEGNSMTAEKVKTAWEQKK